MILSKDQLNIYSDIEKKVLNHASINGNLELINLINDIDTQINKSQNIEYLTAKRVRIISEYYYKHFNIKLLF